MRIKRRKYEKNMNRIIVIICILLGISIFLYVQNNLIKITEVNITSSKIPSNFKSFKILQLSDLHNKEFGDKQDVLIQKVNSINPDIIAITGDLIDSKSYDVKISMDLIREVVKEYPVYFITGNHEKWSGKYNDLEKRIKETSCYRFKK